MFKGKLDDYKLFVLSELRTLGVGFEEAIDMMNVSITTMLHYEYLKTPKEAARGLQQNTKNK